MLAQLIPRVRRAGYQVNVWTVDDIAEMRRLIALGVDGIITNTPDVAAGRANRGRTAKGKGGDGLSRLTHSNRHRAGSRLRCPRAR